jgi:acetyltransferase-like isoleucine patch superfamily enzyme
VSALMLASSIRKLLVRLRNRHATIEFREPVYWGPGCALVLDPGTTFIAGPRAHFRRGVIVEIRGSGRVEIGSDAHFTYNTVIQCTTSIKVGDHCSVGGSMLVDGNHRWRSTDKPMLEQGYEYNPLTIGDYATITTGCVVMADVGERAVVGANAVVTKPVPPYTIAAGVPARVISEFGPED